MESWATWFGSGVTSAFFASLERCSCINLSTDDDDDLDDAADPAEAHDRPLILDASSPPSDAAAHKDEDQDEHGHPLPPV